MTTIRCCKCGDTPLIRQYSNEVGGGREGITIDRKLPSAQVRAGNGGDGLVIVVVVSAGVILPQWTMRAGEPANDTDTCGISHLLRHCGTGEA